MDDIYLTDEKYNVLVSAIFSAAPCPVSDKVSEDQTKIALGEIGDIWPARIKE